MLLAACGDDDGGGAGAGDAPKVTPTPREVTVISTIPALSPTPATGGGRASDERVAFQTEDGVVIRGHVYTAPGPQRRAVIFAHMFTDDQRSWQPFARELAASGVATLTFDFRGYGETGGSRDVSRIDRDLAAAVLFLKSRDYPLIYLVGASMGGTAALKVAASQEVAGVVAVSAPVSFMGLSAQSDVTRVTERKAFLASRNDPEGAAQALQQFMQLAPEPKESFLFEGSAHGTALLQGATAGPFKAWISEFVQR